jgi:phosphoribosyl-AMP cyclohydrolase
MERSDLLDPERHEYLLDAWVARLRAEDPRMVALLVHGSYARGQAQPHSDLDLDVLLDGEPEVGYRSVITALPNGRLLHATIAMYSLADWLEQFQPVVESEEWAFFLAARQDARLLWATEEAHQQLTNRVVLEIAASPQLQDVLEGAAKVRNAYANQDELGVRLAAHDLASRCPGVLSLLNPAVQIRTRREALQAGLSLSVVPPYYREDMLTCLGMSGSATTSSDVHTSAIRLATGILELLRPHAAELAGRIEPDLPIYLANGDLLRLLKQE